MKLKLDENIQYLDMIRDKVDASIKHGYMKVSESFIADNLSRACSDGKRFTVTYIKLQPSEKTFIACCYPDVKELNDMTSSLMSKLNETNTHDFIKTWNSISNWHIEIDERLLQKNSPIAVDNGSQFVAILCHEIGHMLNSFPAALALNYKMNSAKANMMSKALMTNAGRVVMKLCLPMFVCVTGLRILINRPGVELTEMAADAQVPDKYKSHLIDYTERHILKYPETASGIVVTPQEYDHEQDKGIEFSRTCISMMKKRSAILKIHLSTFGKLSSSKYLGEMANFLGETVFSTDPRVNFSIMESFNRSWDMAVMESDKKLNALCESTDVTERDLLLLQVDIDGMQTLDDKAYVLNVICDYIEALQKKREKAIKKAKDITKIPIDATYEEKMKRLNQMKAQVMATKINSYTNGKEYSVYVKYPDGYEG